MTKKTRKTHKMRKVLLTVCCAALLVCVTIGATVAYLTSTATVENTFTVGNVNITLDEAPVDTNGVVTGTTRGTSNDYHLVPGHSYVKDPTIHVTDGSDECYLFVKVENDIASIEKGGETAATNEYLSIADQMAALGWVLVTDETNVYKATTTVEGAVVDAKFVGGNNKVVFNGFTIDEDADVANYYTQKDEDGKIAGGTTVKVTAYAIQADGFNTADAAWDAANLA